MKVVGFLLVLIGWLAPVATLTVTQSMTVRLVLAVIGISISLVGILGVLNKAHLKHAIWKS
ncbi:MAG TPA: hypothetical protein VMT28_06930 [Terriglobales bacterium]|jgi:hypothetical protein|nr:hypothetical protein [Terriglobales bacterium]